ncbi:hypothetical protein D4764_09G0006460 [Takifugu flavidus]|uniref:Uncharacterized protein n=1 Tax=Takifugu flavidus TaxID=433684 RepID=A0A5C6MQB8_9TELE|nr:hypothetical protein D4764_09G0006460 [Takifugu flavidus]
MEESVSTIVAHLTAVMDSLIRASVCETAKLLQEPVNDYLVELSLSKRENEALKHENRAQLHYQQPFIVFFLITSTRDQSKKRLRAVWPGAVWREEVAVVV